MPKPRHKEASAEAAAGYTSDDYYTPKWLFDALGITFDLDPCSPGHGLSNVPARHIYTKDDDGLTQTWHGNVFMNPPFSQMTAWAQKFAQHQNGIAIAFPSRGAWFKHVWSSTAAISLPVQQIRFERPDGQKKGVFMPVILIAYGDQNIHAISKVGHVR